MNSSTTAAATTIIDAHTHISSTRFIPRDFLVGVARNLVVKLQSKGQKTSISRVTELLLGQHQDHMGDQLVQEMDGASIAQSVLLVPDFTQAMQCDLDMWQMAQAHDEIRRRHPGRFKVLLGADPRSGQEGLDIFERSLTTFGFEGLKLYPPCGYSPSDHRLFPYYELCQARGLPVLLHTGPTAPTLSFEYAQPGLIDEAACNFPDVNFILAHGAVNNVKESSLLCAYRSNVYMDLGGFTSVLHPEGWVKHMGDIFKLGINHKIIFGTDWPLFKMGGGHKQLLDQLFAANGPFQGVSDNDKELILHRNINRILPKEEKTSLKNDAPMTCEAV